MSFFFGVLIWAWGGSLVHLLSFVPQKTRKRNFLPPLFRSLSLPLLEMETKGAGAKRNIEFLRPPSSSCLFSSPPQSLSSFVRLADSTLSLSLSLSLSLPGHQRSLGQKERSEAGYEFVGSKYVMVLYQTLLECRQADRGRGEEKRED